ncbi:uncharacterized protein LOC133883565 [Phragmites australis]|uniref:uncharacterized protein LOC133883565 n=1 Tax=Phragmites australis TaxID=29695 RepID=UPI002D77AAD6|nr:uncharacterized protein LOC133883565 [Phragmites australis]
MGRQRSSARSVLLPDDSARLLLQARFASARSIGESSAPSPMGIEEEDVVGWPTATSMTMALPRKKAPRAHLGTAFRCPSCRHADSVECRIDIKGKAAEASCWACGASYAAGANSLTEPIDVYGEWIDACERARADGGVDVRRDYDDDEMMVDAWM